MAAPIRTFNVRPHWPQRLAPLWELAYNLYWTRHAAAIALFRRLDPELWEQQPQPDFGMHCPDPH
ncbi:MAG TPA: DUF3417 domain-containing protein [Thermosynechococcus sp. M3746_W2019_013]|nr:DUF3417 domain-containing protein [Thermosynechococcus sp. M3746_W2019_013]